MMDELTLLEYIDAHVCVGWWRISVFEGGPHLADGDEARDSLAYYAGLGLIEDKPEWRGYYNLTDKGKERLAELRGERRCSTIRRTSSTR